MGTRAEQIVADFPVAATHLDAFATADTPEENRGLTEEFGGVPLGSGVPYTVMLQRQIFAGRAGAIPDRNLDADRGWAHRNWVITPGSEDSVDHDSMDPVPYAWAG